MDEHDKIWEAINDLRGTISSIGSTVAVVVERDSSRAKQMTELAQTYRDSAGKNEVSFNGLRKEMKEQFEKIERQLSGVDGEITLWKRMLPAVLYSAINITAIVAALRFLKG